MTVLFLRPSEDSMPAWASALQEAEAAVTVVAPWDTAVALTETCADATPMDEAMFEFIRMYRDPGPSVVSPAIADLLNNAAVIVNDHVEASDAWCKNIKRFAKAARVLCVSSDADPAELVAVWDVG